MPEGGDLGTRLHYALRCQAFYESLYVKTWSLMPLKIVVMISIMYPSLRWREIRT